MKTVQRRTRLCLAATSPFWPSPRTAQTPAPPAAKSASATCCRDGRRCRSGMASARSRRSDRPWFHHSRPRRARRTDEAVGRRWRHGRHDDHPDSPRPGRRLPELRPADARHADGARFAVPHLLDVEADHRRRDDAALRAGQVAARRSDHQVCTRAREPERADLGPGRQGRDRRRRQAGTDVAQEAGDHAPVDEPHGRIRLRPVRRRSGQQGVPRRARAGARRISTR